MNIISGGNAPFTYLWSDGQTSDTAINLSAGTYTCVITYNNNCDTSVTVTINQPDQLVFDTTTQDVNCFGGNDGSAWVNIISGGNAPFNYLWSNGQTSDTAINLSAGTYTCIITYNNDCDTSVTVTINQPELIDTNVTISSCGTFIWYDTFFDSSGQYILNDTAQNGCDSIITLNLNITNTISIDSINPIMQIVCENGPINDICVDVSGGTGTYQYQWWEIVNVGTPTPATGTGSNTDCYTSK